jgi:hypothetical protein
VRRRGSEQPGEVDSEVGATDSEPVDGEELSVDRLKARMTESLGDRPFTVYLVLFAGAATLLLLLAVVWISATGDDDDDNLFCTEISPADARDAVIAGQVEEINVLVDNDRPTDSLTGIRLRFSDLSCRETRQGADIRDQLYSIIGVVGVYNEFGSTRVDIRYLEQEIQPELLATSTPTVRPSETATQAPSEEATPIAPTPTGVPATDMPTSVPTVQSVTTIGAPAGPSATSAPDAGSQDEAPVGNPGA